MPHDHPVVNVIHSRKNVYSSWMYLDFISLFVIAASRKWYVDCVCVKTALMNSMVGHFCHWNNYVNHLIRGNVSKIVAFEFFYRNKKLRKKILLQSPHTPSHARLRPGTGFCDGETLDWNLCHLYSFYLIFLVVISLNLPFRNHFLNWS